MSRERRKPRGIVVARLLGAYVYLFPLALGVNLPALLGLDWDDLPWIKYGAYMWFLAVLLKGFLATSLKRDMEELRKTLEEGIRYLIDDLLDVFEFSVIQDSASDQNIDESLGSPERLEKQRLERFQTMLVQVPHYIASLAGRAGVVEAQIFVACRHNGHSHFVSRYSNKKPGSKKHFSNLKNADGGFADPVAGEVWTAAEHNLTRAYKNLTWRAPLWGDKPYGWRRFAKHKHATFMTTPIFSSDDQPAGLLTINATRPNALTAVDADVIELVAQMIQSANLLCGYLDEQGEYETMVPERQRRCKG